MVASFRPRMLSEGDGGSPAKCRERRRRRIEMRRLSSLSAAGPSPQPAPGPGDGHAGGSSPCASGAKRIRASDGSCCLLPSSSSASSGDDAEAPVAPPQPEPGVVAAATSVEWYGAMSVPGRLREMEDAISVRTGLCRPELNGRRPVHFFAVFDGHGGDHVSRLCREKMHVFLEEELTRARELQQADEDDVWREAMRTSFRRMDEVAMNTCACGSVGSGCGCHPMELALGGSTAVATVLTPDRIVVANCGDSRAVLCRGGKAVPLSRDQKPDRPDELARIEAAGGLVIYQNGARVEGILAMSRAIGDKYLKPVVTSEPEITFTARQAEDDCLILASDGLWDVLSSELACEVAFECLRDGSPPPAMDLNSGPAAEDDGNRALFPSRSVLAASLLTRLALGRKSWDNISVIVVDLKKS